MSGIAPSDVLRPPDAVAELSQRGTTRLAVVSDYLEENWPSMELMADMLTQFVPAAAPDIQVAQLRPRMRQRFVHIPLLGRRRAALNGDRLFNRFVDYPFWLRTYANRFDLFHVADHSYSQLLHVLPKDRVVVTCHDLDTFRCLLEPGREARSRAFRVMSRRILDGFQRAAHVVAVSEATRRELLHHNLVPADSVSVIPNGVHPSCSACPDPQADLRAANLMPEEHSSGARGTIWLLSVGSTIERKRLDVLLRVFAAVRRIRPEVRLLRVGGLTPKLQDLARNLDIEQAVVAEPFLERRVLAAVYRRSAMLLHTADAEGFGLPLVEAMACGCPVVASDIPVLRETGGNAASFCPVADIDQWSSTVSRLLDERNDAPDLWRERRQLSVAWASRYSWAENARNTVTIYKKVMETR